MAATTVPHSQTNPQKLYLVILHDHVVGRTRIKIPGLYRNESLGESLEAYLTKMDEVSLARANTLTGNLLIEYLADRSSEKFLLEVGKFLEKEFNRPVLRSTESV